MGRKSVECVVLGAGPAGLAAAIVLRRAGIVTTVVAPPPTQEEAQRTLPESAPAMIEEELRGLDAWPGPAAGFIPTARTASAWGTDHFWHDAFAIPGGLGWQVDRSVLSASLRSAAQRVGVCWSRTRPPETRIVVDATGRSSVVARRHGVVPARADRLIAIIGALPPRAETDQTIGTASSDCRTAIQAVETGFWYAVSNGQHRWAALFTDADIGRRLDLSSRTEAWTSLLTRAELVHEIVGPPRPPLTLTTRSARSQCLPTVAGDGWIAAGDAACAVDPLSSSGMIWALRSGAAAARTALASLAGDASGIPAYQRRVHGHFGNFLSQRREIYRQVGKWSDSPFWRRRTTVDRGGMLNKCEE
jgi:flavin-dependent dehydrogenase